MNFRRTTQFPLSIPPPAAPATTLIEVMVVVAILGVMAAVAVPNLLPLLHAGKVSGTAQQVAGFLEATRARAVAEGRCYRVRAQSTAVLIQERRTGTDCVKLSAEGWQGPLRSLPVPGAVFTVDAMTTDTFDGANNRIIFRPSSRLRGNGDRVTTDDHARIALAILGVDDKATVEIMASGRICTRSVGTTLPALAVFQCP
jgi:prepilin-type N-terminal cleavage/methylation domain-containing protein